jgi:hypothetical protein
MNAIIALPAPEPSFSLVSSATDWAHKYHAQGDPDKTRQPAECNGSDDRPRDRARRSDRRKMLSEKIERPRGNKILAIVYLNSRCCTAVVQLELSGDPAPVSEVSENKPNQKDES